HRNQVRQLHEVLEDVFGGDQVVAPEVFGDVSGFVKEQFHLFKILGFGGRFRDVGFVGWWLQFGGQAVLIQQNTVARVKLVGEIGTGGGVLHLRDGHQGEIDIEAMLSLNDISGTLKSVFRLGRIAVEGKHTPEGFQPLTTFMERVNVGEDEDHVVVGENIQFGIGDGTGAGHYHRPHRWLFFAPRNQARDNFILCGNVEHSQIPSLDRRQFQPEADGAFSVLADVIAALIRADASLLFIELDRVCAFYRPYPRRRTAKVAQPRTARIPQRLPDAASLKSWQDVEGGNFTLIVFEQRQADKADQLALVVGTDVGDVPLTPIYPIAIGRNRA